MAQDMPPPGGFGTFSVARTLPRPFLRNGAAIASFFVFTTFYGAHQQRKYIMNMKAQKAEIVEHYIAVEPFIIAERERKFLKHLRLTREDERELMKDHKGWIVGTLYGEPVYKTRPKGELPIMPANEYAAHVNLDTWNYSRHPDFFI